MIPHTSSQAVKAYNLTKRFDKKTGPVWEWFSNIADKLPPTPEVTGAGDWLRLNEVVQVIDGFVFKAALSPFSSHFLIMVRCPICNRDQMASLRDVFDIRLSAVFAGHLRCHRPRIFEGLEWGELKTLRPSDSRCRDERLVMRDYFLENTAQKALVWADNLKVSKWDELIAASEYKPYPDCYICKRSIFNYAMLVRVENKIEPIHTECICLTPAVPKELLGY